MTPSTLRKATWCEIASWILTAIVLVLVLVLHLLPALLAGLLVYELVHILAPRLKIWRMTHEWSKVFAVTVLSVIVVVLLALIGFGIVAVLRTDANSVSALLKQMAEIVDGSRRALPPWVMENMPANADELRTAVVTWLREHARDLRGVGSDFGRALVHIVIGLIIGAFVCLRQARHTEERGPLAEAMLERATRVGDAFRRIVFAQVRISGLNTLLTAVYLTVILPLCGVNLPLTKTLIAVCFVAGLLPVVGNLISNSVIVIVSLNHSIYAALGSLAFLIVIHKLEYFVNARIVGTQIRARAWELLVAMLAMEAAFGIAGVVAAPIYYAYLKNELQSRGLI
ncbi:MAG: AI-2E family transporter [Betaproteobacteria bacterium]